jgi:hypothetical protein
MHGADLTVGERGAAARDHLFHTGGEYSDHVHIAFD